MKEPLSYCTIYVFIAYQFIYCINLFKIDTIYGDIGFPQGKFFAQWNSTWQKFRDEKLPGLKIYNHIELVQAYAGWIREHLELFG